MITDDSKKFDILLRLRMDKYPHIIEHSIVVGKELEGNYGAINKGRSKRTCMPCN